MIRPVSDAPLHLIACSAGKAAHAAPARDLYTGQLFRASRRYAEAQRAPWAILSAKHGLVMPGQLLEPYDAALAGRPEWARLQWGEQVAQLLCGMVPDCAPIVVLAGRAYREAIMASPIARASSWDWQVPMAGLGIGQQKAWLAARV